MKKRLAILLLTVLAACSATAQQPAEGQDGGQAAKSTLDQYRKEKTTVPYKADRKSTKARRVATRKGNSELKKKNNSSALNLYRNALKADSSYAKAQYNRALAHSRLGQNDSALAYNKKLCENRSATPAQRANAHYNSGNIHLRKALAARDTGGYDGQSLHLAIDEYKAGLRLDPQNNDAKHNLSLARQLLRPEQQNGGGQGQQKQNQQQQDQQQNQQQQNQQQDQQQQDQQQQDQQQSQQQQQNQQQQQQQSRREAEQMLNAMKNNEQQTMKAIRMKEAEKERRQGHPVKIEKDW